MSGEKPAARLRGRVRILLIPALALPLLSVGACDSNSTSGASPTTTSPPAPSTPTGTSTPAETGTGAGTDTTAPGTPPAASPPTSRPPEPTPRRVSTAVYFMHGEFVSAAPRTVTGPATAAGSLRALLAGPSDYESRHGRTTAIPSGTTLRSLSVRDRVATVDLSGRYDDGGGTLSMRARLAQVVFTVTRHPTIDKVRFQLDGKPVTAFGGEGIVLNRPVGRADFEDVAPVVLIESPLIGDSIRTPVRVWGSANTFEAEFRLKVTDVNGRTAADVQVMATSGSGTRGTFDVTFPYRAGGSGAGVLTAYFYSPEDGRPVTVDTVPLTVNR
ncbi:GerMN domain-containing protein [Streptomyces sp. NPDC018693]|uniref:GerMN domain-containing protein n=1 Tax=unclassified Streptomyces TaxID=2593676 RepID=UPI00378B85D7